MKDSHDATAQVSGSVHAAASELVTVLFTDIEGSTEKWEATPQRMAQAVARHDVLLREAVEAHRGRVIKTTGDGIYAAFADAGDGIAAVVAIQVALADPAATAGVPIAVRCGLHRGVAEQRDNDYFGTTINRAARMTSAAHGGQVLVSQAVVAAVRERRLPDVGFRDLGSVRLKGLAAAEHVFQVLHPRLRPDFPALRSLESTPSNLPQQITSFVGRETELAEAEALLSRARLLTLLGMGGLGKTRLALQVGGEALDDFPDGVWFVDLAPIRDPALVPVETAKVLGLRDEPGVPLVDTLGNHLKSRKLLLILDNCEHLVSASAHLANALLRTAPEIRILATSREALHLPGEQVYPVLPLPLPLPDRSDGVEALSHSPAVQLFVERAQSHKPTFTLNDHDAHAVAELVARLEGIPLAIELAAARVRTQSVADINARLKDRYKLLTGGGRVLLERQQTLRALVDWSYDLLPQKDQILLARLSAFSGRFDLAAAEAVCGTEPLAPEDIDDLLVSLVDKSLVMPEESESGTRYRMLETIRDYARIKLIERGELAKLSTRHCDYYLVMAKAGNRGLQGPDQAEWIPRLEANHDNMRTAIAHALGGTGDPIIAAKMEVALMGFRTLRGYATEGRANVRALLSLPAIHESDIAHAHTLYVGANLANSQGDNCEAQRMLETCLALRRGIGNEAEIAATLSTLAAVRLRLGDAVRARQGEEEALAIFRRLGHRIEESIVLAHLGGICVYTGNAEEAKRFLEESLTIARAVKYQETESDCERTLGKLALESGDLAAARDRFQRALLVCEAGGDLQGAAKSLCCLAEVDIATGDTGVARRRLGEAMRAFQSFQVKSGLIGALEDQARLARVTGFPEEAARLHSAAAAAREKLVLRRAPRDDQRWRDEVDAVRTALGAAAFEVAWAEGHEWELNYAVSRTLDPTFLSTLAA
ncbi:MAG: tetratricopeptide repeat protein [Betaproteobacteria bacterium]|nr:tetratricopeptide repeat protein [Betaproteobacteria bacterium]